MVKSVFGEVRPSYLPEKEAQRQRPTRGCFRSFLETGRVHTTKGSLLPVRPRYRREVDGQRLSAKADDKVCCFSPVRRSTTYQMSCFLPERSQEHTVVYTCLLWEKNITAKLAGQDVLCAETGLKFLGCQRHF